jgi:hypothetical protein
VQVAREDIAADRLDDLAPHPARRIHRQVIADSPHQEQHEDPGRHVDQHAGVALDESAVQELLDQHREAGVDRRKQHHAEHPQQEHGPVRARIREEAQVGLQAARGERRQRDLILLLG